MKTILRASRHVVVVAVLGCLVMFGLATIVAAIAVANTVAEVLHGGTALSQLASVTAVAFKILDLFLVGAILYIVALGLGALFLDTKGALPAWFEIREFDDLKVVLWHSIIIVLLVSFLGDVLEWEQGTDIVFVGGGIAMVIAAVAFMQRDGSPRRDDGPRPT